MLATLKRESPCSVPGEAKTPSKRSPRPVPAKALQNVSSPCKRSTQEDFRLTFSEDDSMLLCSERWLSGSHVSGTALMLRKLPDKFLNQHPPHKVGGRRYRKVIKPAQARDSKRYSWAALAYFSITQNAAAAAKPHIHLIAPCSSTLQRHCARHQHPAAP